MGEHYSLLSALVRVVRHRWRRMSALRAWTIGAASAALVVGLALLTYHLAAPEGGALIGLWTVAAVAAVIALAWALLPLRGGPTPQQIARYIEERCPELEDALVTAVARRPAPADPPSAMADAVAADAVRRTAGLDLDRIISSRDLRAATIRAMAATVVLCLIAGFAAGPVGRAARVLAIYLFPAQFALDVTPGDIKVREGAPLRIQVQVPGAADGLVPVLRVSSGSRTPSGLREPSGFAGPDQFRDIRMEPAVDGFAVSFDRVVEGFRYSVTAAGVSSREYAVTVIRPPHVERIDLRYEYPAAFGMPPRQDDDGGDIYGPAGTRVHITVHADKPVTEAALTLSGGQRVTLTERGGALEGDLTIAEDGSYRVALADGDGLSNSGDTEYFIRTLEDGPPDVRIVRPAADRQVTPIEEVPIEAWADDDFGVASLELVYAIRGGTPKSVSFDRDGSGTSVRGKQTIYLEDLGVKPGDFVTYYARARDVSRGKRSTEARSDIFFLEVTPFEEEFVASQSQGAGGGDDEAMDDMVQAQKDIITATWKLDSRAMQAGGRSESDIRTVARAQGALRTRALGIVAQMQRANNVRRMRPGGGRAAAPAQGDPAPDAMSKAAEAMLQAQQRLETLKTTDALPHEMTALNELLRAQSEQKRREVQQQQANGNGRGNNRQQQDLSSLFDRELARQQQTNYETPTSSETRKESEQKDDTLDKIRELARRQDELNKQQEQMAKRQGASEEEMRRQLERLTREQSELRREAEALSQQLQQAQQQQNSQSGQRGRGGQGAQGSSQQSGRGGQPDQSQQQASRELQQISEEMQGAASELRRDNRQQASERGNRAAERLRDLEQRMRSAQPDDRRRAMGELQLESRQLADAQRKLAGEGGSRGRGENADDASRRRAGEQDRLAERTQRLEQSVKQLAAAGGGTERERSAVSEAARELERQKLSERMRNAARAERQGGAGPAGQPPSQPPQASGDGQAIASALDKLAERLGSADGQSEASRQLSEQLSRIRELREKLTQLDRQLKEQNEGTRGSSPGGRGRGSANGQSGDSDRPWDQASELLEQMRSQKVGELDSPTADGFNPGRSAPGTEAWKQDFAKWEELKTQIAASLERAESSAAARLRDQQTTDRLSAGASQTVPEQYRRLVNKYYEALASPSAREKR